jgi:hypothetical protein
MAERLQITDGEVIEVQLTSETYVMAPGEGGQKRRRKPRRAAAAPAGKILNRMRVFVREPDGKERNYDFEGARVGVHDGHRVCIVRGRCATTKDPLNLMLCNLSTEDRDLYESAILRFLDQPRMFGPFWRAVGLSLWVWLIVSGLWALIVTHGRHFLTVSIYALFFMFLAFPLIWGGVALWDRLSEKRRFEDGRAKLIADVEAHIAKLPRTVTSGV